MILVNSIFGSIKHDVKMETCDQTSSQNSRDELIKEYVSICNRALEQGRSRFPFKQIFKALEKASEADVVEVVVLDTAQTYAFHFDASGINVENHADCKDCQCVRQWTTSSKYLRDVVKNPQAYIQNPAKLNWDWMYDC